VNVFVVCKFKLTLYVFCILLLLTYCWTFFSNALLLLVLLFAFMCNPLCAC